MFSFFFFHWFQKSLRVQGGHSCLYLAFKGSLKPGPREGYTHTRLYVHTKTARVSETEPKHCSHLPSLYFTRAHSFPVCSQIAGAFDVLQKTIARASALFCDSSFFLALVEISWLFLFFFIVPSSPVSLSNVSICSIQGAFLSECVHNSFCF